VASSSGFGWLVLFGLVALASADPACGAETTTADDTGDEFSFSAGDSSSEGDDEGLFGGSSDEDDDFSFEPEDGASASGCDDVVIVQSGEAEVDVPGESRVIQEESVECSMSEGEGDSDAVAALQDALVRCNGQSVTVDGNYGPQTTAAVAAVQAQNGLDADGTYGTDTMRAMSWPVSTSSGVTCVDIG
jgi:peptidoglycan hydrolase-like protein with peptidoglycan-binding domain